MGMIFVVVRDRLGELLECGDRIRKRVHAFRALLEGFDEALGDGDLIPGFESGVKQGTRLRAVAKARVSVCAA